VADPLRTFLPIDTKTSFPVTDGRELILQRGTVRCLASFELAGERHKYADDSDWVIARLDLPDRSGRVFRLERRLAGHVFLELLATVRSHDQQEPEVLLHCVHCAYDHRIFIPTFAVVGEHAIAVAYGAKQLTVNIDLLAYRAPRANDFDSLGIRVPALETSGLGRTPTPMISVRTAWAARVIVWPGVLQSTLGPYGEQPVFAPTALSAEPQERVIVSP
jgi:hypothetical protein